MLFKKWIMNYKVPNQMEQSSHPLMWDWDLNSLIKNIDP